MENRVKIDTWRHYIYDIIVMIILIQKQIYNIYEYTNTEYIGTWNKNIQLIICEEKKTHIYSDKSKNK